MISLSRKIRNSQTDQTFNSPQKKNQPKPTRNQFKLLFECVCFLRSFLLARTNREERRINQTQWSVKRETRRRKISNWLVWNQEKQTNEWEKNEVRQKRNSISLDELVNSSKQKKTKNLHSRASDNGNRCSSRKKQQHKITDWIKLQMRRAESKPKREKKYQLLQAASQLDIQIALNSRLFIFFGAFRPH